jgi:glycosyltransferase involved in cell wall biosynthesis
VKIACVVHRYGADIAGGSEGHCRLIAEHLAATHDVTVVTTTARDHVTWANHYPPGRTNVGGLDVLRFPVARPRDLHRFRDISNLVFSDRGTPEQEAQWFRENGPDAPGLLAFLEQSGRQFDLVLFWAFRYFNSYFGMPLVADRAVLVPTAEDDPLIRVDSLDRFFSLPQGYLFLTPEEEALIGARAPSSIPRRVIGCGIDPPDESDRVRLTMAGISSPYVLYLGRIDPNKGCDTLLKHFRRYVERTDGVSRAAAEVSLVLAGPANMPVPSHPRIRHLGYVDDAARNALLEDAQALVMPSPYESLSMVLLESWNQGTPAIVNARCAVLKGQVLRADGGLYYQNATEFAGALDYVLDHGDAARELGAQGRAYVDREYRWPTVLGKIESLLAEIRPRR